MKKIVFCLVTVLLMACVLCLPLFSAGASGTPYKLGDVDGDGEVTAIDVTTIQRYLVGLADLSEDEKMRADVDGNRVVEIIDVTYIQRWLAHMDVQYAIGEIVTEPTEPATDEPTIAPTEAPTQASTQAPTQAPTQRPTTKPDPYELPPI